MDQLRKLLASLTVKQRVTVVLAVVLAGAGIFAATRWRRERDFRPLYSGLAAEDAAAIIGKLKEGGVEYRLSEDGASVLVPSARVAESRLAMASSGLPKSGRIGFELFDKSNFGVTDFTEQVNFRRALEGELERSIMLLAGVDQARVHLTFPQDSVFLESRRPAKASVLLRLRDGSRLAPQSVLAVTHLVASAVEGLAAESVSVLDMRGNLLNRPRRASLDADEPSEALLDYRQRIEKDLLAKISATLDPLLGPEGYRAGVVVECDFSSGEQSEETFDPTKSVMVSSQKTEDGAGTTSASGVPGTASNLPRPSSRPETAAGRVSRRTENIVYQSSRTIRRTRLPQGSVKRISASVLVDQAVTWEGTGPQARRVLVPPPPERLKAIRDLVAAVAGLVPDRGDQLIVESLPFESTLKAEPPGIRQDLPAPAPQSPPAGGLRWLEDAVRKRQMPVLVGLGAGVLVVLASFALLLRRLFRRSSRAQVSVGPPELAAAGSAPALPAMSADKQIEAKLAEHAALQQRMDAEMANSLKLPPVTSKKTEVLAKILREGVTKEAEVSAHVLKGWLSEDAQ